MVQIQNYLYNETLKGSVKTFAPWASDPEFLDVIGHMYKHTLVDSYRLYELWTLAKQSSKVEGDILEIGVWRGGSGALLCKAVDSFPKKVYLADTFEGVVKCSDKDTKYKGGEHADTTIDIVNDLLQEMNIKNAIILKGIFPEDTHHSIQHPVFALIHVDVDVYQSAKECVEWALPYLSIGGCIVFDDYGFEPCQGVTRYCHELAEQSDLLFLYNLNGHAVFIRIQKTVN